MENRETLKREDDDESVSDDSLEVVVVRKSLERKCEKVVSGRRSKTPRESSKETKFTKTHRSTRRKLKSSKSKASDNGESTDRVQSFDKEQGAKESAFHTQRTPRTSLDEDKGNGENIIESRYRRDVTDSTSQETVERVVVTAMVHKDQGPDTPKSMVESSKEVTFDDRLRTEIIEIEEVSKEASSVVGKVDDILEQNDASRNNLVQKAANLKKDVEEMRQQGAQEKTQREKDSRHEETDEKQDQREESGDKDDIKVVEGKEDTKEADDEKKDQDEKIESSPIEDKEEKKDDSEKCKTFNEIIISSTIG